MINYYNLWKAPIDIERISNNWGKIQPIVMVVNSAMSRELAIEYRNDENRLFGLTISGGLSCTAKDNTFFQYEPSEKDFHKMCCDAEIKGQAVSAFPYSNMIYTPDKFFTNFLTYERRIWVLEDIFLANERYFKLDTICFQGDWRFDDSDENETEKGAISNELKLFFNSKHSNVLKNVICFTF
jgi:hypothetical protein